VIDPPPFDPLDVLVPAHPISAIVASGKAKSSVVRYGRTLRMNSGFLMAHEFAAGSA
jgi:hypothetical protein